MRIMRACAQPPVSRSRQRENNSYKRLGSSQTSKACQPPGGTLGSVSKTRPDTVRAKSFHGQVETGANTRNHPLVWQRGVDSAQPDVEVYASTESSLPLVDR